MKTRKNNPGRSKNKTIKHTRKYTRETTQKKHSNSKGISQRNTKGISQKLIIGCHVSISPSILSGLHYLENINGNAAQIFLGSNRSASIKTKTKITPENIIDIRQFIRNRKITLLIHSIYLLNFCIALPNSGKVKYMHDNIQHDLHIGAAIGAKCVILHLGFRKELNTDIAIENLIANINKIILDMPDKIMLSLETSAGTGSQLGYTLEELATIWNGVKKHNTGTGTRTGKKVGICIDTAHIFVGGYAIDTIEGIKDYLERFNKMIGLENITNFHINDSRFPKNSRKDEHRGIGHGLLYPHPTNNKSLKYLKTFCQKRKIPLILETHGAGSDTEHGSHAHEHGYKWEIALMQNI
jgi:deoxyribonuclease-4